MKDVVVVLGVQGPIPSLPLGLKIACDDLLLGHPKTIVHKEHLARRIGLPFVVRHLFNLRGRDEQTKALGPIRAPHSTASHSDHASCQNHQKRQPKGPSGQREQPAFHAFKA